MNALSCEYVSKVFYAALDLMLLIELLLLIV